MVKNKLNLIQWNQPDPGRRKLTLRWLDCVRGDLMNLAINKWRMKALDLQ